MFNNAGGAVGTQLGNLALSINISERSGIRKKKVCVQRVCNCVSVCVTAWL